MATSNAGVVYYCPAKNVPQKMCNVPAKRLRWSEASFLIFGGTLFFDFFISCVVKIHEKNDLFDLCFYSENVPFC